MACKITVSFSRCVIIGEIMEKLSYKLPSFEGPLDLLLYLLSKHKLDICDIPIAELLEQYMMHMEEMKQQDMEIESEFLTMAARLVHMKTMSLLPKHEELEELQDELVTQLLDYQQCKRMAQMVKDRLELGTFVREQMKLKKDLTYRGHHDTAELLLAYQTAVGKGKRFLPPPMESFSAIVATPTVSVASRMIYVLRCLWKEHEVTYTKVFEEAESKSQMVATFLAVLELVKGKRVRVEDENGSSKLVLLDGGERNWKRKHKKVQ